MSLQVDPLSFASFLHSVADISRRDGTNFSFEQVDPSVAVAIESIELLRDPEELAPRDVPIAVAIHGGKPFWCGIAIGVVGWLRMSDTDGDHQLSRNRSGRQRVFSGKGMGVAKCFERGAKLAIR